MKTAVVILNWNGATMLRRYLPSVVAYSDGAEVWVADNASTDDSLRVLQQEFPMVKTLVLDKNYGFAEGYNRAIEHIEAEYIVLLNSDVRVTKGWLSPLESFLDNHPDTVALQPKILKDTVDEKQLTINNAESENCSVNSVNSCYNTTGEKSGIKDLCNSRNSLIKTNTSEENLCNSRNSLIKNNASEETKGDRFEYAGASGGFVDKFGYPYCRGRLFDVVEEDHGQYDEPMEIHWATGACMMIRREDYRCSGGLDGRFFAHNEEIDLCWRLRILGHKIMCVPSSAVYHLGGGTLPQGNPRKTYLNFRNNLTMLYKNLPQQTLRKVMLARMVLDYVAALQSILKGNVGDVKAIIRARRDFHAWQHDFDADRAWIAERRKLDAKRDLSPFSVLYRFFVLRNRHWSDLPAI